MTFLGVFKGTKSLFFEVNKPSSFVVTNPSGMLLGQLSIRGQRLCNIALRTPYSSTIPAQLPPNLDVNHVMGLSDLKKKLPEAAFGKRNYIENEVCFQGVYFSLYEVEISNKDQYKMDQLIENLKEKDLVSVLKYCRSGRNVAMFMPDEFILLSLLMIFPLALQTGWWTGTTRGSYLFKKAEAKSPNAKMIIAKQKT
uniref:Transcription activation suppressor family member 2 n=1 Tax=Calidris pygmaea TaxID=425635 RepID=A0A8C3K7D6_9CHAR